MSENQGIGTITPQIIKATDGRIYEIYPMPATEIEPVSPISPYQDINPNRYTAMHLLFGASLIVGGLLGVALILNSVRPSPPVILPQPINKPSCVAFC